MIPFSIMNVYGNIVRTVEIKKALGGRLSAFILYSDGKLYGAGANNYGELGFGYTGWNGSTPQWTLIDTGVDDIWCGRFSLGYVCRKGTEYYYIGSGAALAMSGNILSYRNLGVSSVIGSTEEILDIVCTGTSIHILTKMTNGLNNVYSCGDGPKLGRNSSTNSSSLVLSDQVPSTYVLQIDANDNAFYALCYNGIGTTGTLYNTGRNVSNQINTSQSGTIVNTFTQQLTSCSKFRCGGDYFIALQNGILYGRGDNSLQCISEWSTANPISSVQQIAGFTNLSSDIVLLTATYSSGFILSNKMYVIGSGSFMAGPTAKTVTSYTKVLPGVLNFDNISTSFDISFFGSGTEWYITSVREDLGIRGTLQSNGTYKLPTDIST